MFALRPVKRLRDDSDSEDDGRYLKKTRAWSAQLPQHGSINWPSESSMRPSLIASPPRAVPGLEPATRTRSERSETESPASVDDEPIHFSSPRRPEVAVHDDMDMDMDMDDTNFDVVGSPPPETPLINAFHAPLRPAKLDSSSFGRDTASSNLGRIPTPMHPRFPVPGHSAYLSSMNGFGYPASGMAGGIGMDPENGLLGAPRNPILHTPPVLSRQNTGDLDRSRRVPSPICEAEDFPDTPTALTQSQLSQLSMDEQMELEAMEAEASPAPPPGVNTTPTKGRKRSGALSGKGRFSMGYREDCEKCRLRVPGHYSHFLP